MEALFLPDISGGLMEPADKCFGFRIGGTVRVTRRIPGGKVRPVGIGGLLRLQANQPCHRLVRKGTLGRRRIRHMQDGAMHPYPYTTAQPMKASLIGRSMALSDVCSAMHDGFRHVFFDGADGNSYSIGDLIVG